VGEALVIAGRYEVVRQLGKGGMGAVYQARQISMDRMVALKLIHPQVASSAEAIERFHREMQATSRIEHPNTIQVFDYGEAEDGQLFLAMEFLDGRPLSKLLSESGPLPLLRLIHIAEQIVRALGAAHQRGIVHRDLKPDNVMLLERYGEPDFVKVLDFGIARFLEGDTRMTAEGALIGTPLYMSAEQAQGQAVDHRTDFYSLGVMLYEMALGKLPFNGPTMASLLVAHAHDAPPAPSTVAPGLLPAPLEALILKLLSKSPDERPGTAAELLHELDACRGNDVAKTQPDREALAQTLEAPKTRQEPITESVPPPRAKKRSVWPWVILGAVAVGGAGEWAALHWKKRDDGGAARARLDALELAEGEPLPAANCRSTDTRILEALARGAAWLHDGTVGATRAQDRDALMLLEGLQAEASTEYWTLLSRARLVANADGAVEAAERAVQKCADYAPALNAVGNAEQRQKQLERATTAYRRALTLAPDYVAPRFNLGVVALRGGDAAGAVAAFDLVLQKNPQHPRAHLARGQAHLMLQQIPAALDDLEQAALRHPDEAETWLLLGKARALAKTPSTANEAFCRAKALGNAEAAKLCE
jgi:tetratricopeptide (TPR) repeat protein/predicted Ser/Thr protein kinase